MGGCFRGRMLGGFKGRENEGGKRVLAQLKGQLKSGICKWVHVLSATGRGCKGLLFEVSESVQMHRVHEMWGMK